MSPITLPTNLSENDAGMLARLLREATTGRFFGSIELSFQNGRLAYGRITRAEKPDVPGWVHHGPTAPTAPTPKGGAR